MSTPAPGRPGVLVVADDLTGANATAAGLARTGLRAVTVAVTGDRGADVLDDYAGRFDAVVACTESRHSPPAVAARLVADTVAAGWPAALVSLRVDSTLRGSVGACTVAVLDQVTRLSGGRVVALCSPAHPDAGRQTVAGTQLLGGRRLEDTEVARDARTPVTSSDVAALFGRDQPGVTRALALGSLSLDEITGSAEALAARVRTLLDDGVDVLVADALTTDHLSRIARAAVTGAAQAAQPVTWVSVDPGPGTVALAGALGLAEQTSGRPLLAVSGSATELTRTQLARLRSEREVSVVSPVTDPRGVPDVSRCAEDLAAALAAAAGGTVVLMASVLESGDLVEPDGATAAAIPAALAEIARQALQHRPADGVFATGGDLAAALLAALGAGGLAVEEELVPLAVAGTVVDGPWNGLPIVTKGGLVGDADTTVVCLDHLARAAASRRLRVSPATRAPIEARDPRPSGSPA